MTDLQLGLAVIGALAVVAVVLYNRWQERGARRDAERAFGSGHADVLLREERREPTLEARRPAPPPGALPAERVDYVVELTLPRPAAPAARRPREIGDACRAGLITTTRFTSLPAG